MNLLNSRQIKDWIKSSMLALMVIPSTSGTGWQIEKYSKIPANEVSFSDKGILVQVKKSASPMIYKFNSEIKVKGFKVTGEFKGLPQFADILKQGSSGNDDYPLRIGFIIPGEKRLNAIKKLFVAEWIKKLYNNVPVGSGLDFVQFFNITQNSNQKGQNRIHPISDLIHENFFDVVSKNGPFNYSFSLTDPIKSVALWISIDGDDTKSEYDVLISNLSLETE